MPVKLPLNSTLNARVRQMMFEQPEERGRIVFRVPSNNHGPGGYYTCPANADGHPYMRYADSAWYVEKGDWVKLPTKGSGMHWAEPATKLSDVDKAEILLQAQEV